MTKKLWVLLWSLMIVSSVVSAAEEAPVREKMTNARLGEVIKRLDEDSKGGPGFWQISVSEHVATVITDEQADRMRIVIAVADAESLEKEHLFRLLQANFDTALDGRYAIARGRVWATFIHPLGDLTEDEFFSGLLQVVNLVETYGTSFSSNTLQFSGGDAEQYRQELERKNQI